MKKLAFLALASCLVLSSCSGNPSPKQKQAKAPNPIEASKVVYPEADSLPAWSAWLGRPETGEKMIATSSADEHSLLYIKGRDLLRVRAGQPPQQAVSVQTYQSKNNSENNLRKNLKPSRTIKTRIGLAYIQPDGRRAYIINGNRSVVVSLYSASKMRLALKYLRWVDDPSSQDEGSFKLDGRK